MTAAKLDLTIEQGSTFRQQLEWKTNNDYVDLNGFSARMQIRTTVESLDVIKELSTENAGIIFLNSSQGLFQLFISANDTSSFDFNNAVYDLEMTASNGDIFRLIEGRVVISKGVTR